MQQGHRDTITGSALTPCDSHDIASAACMPNHSPTDRHLVDLRGDRAARPNTRASWGGPYTLRSQWHRWPHHRPRCGSLGRRCVSVHLGRIRNIVNPFYIILTYIYIYYTTIGRSPNNHCPTDCRAVEIKRGWPQCNCVCSRNCGCRLQKQSWANGSGAWEPWLWLTNVPNMII